MRIEEWTKKLKKCKRSHTNTAFFRVKCIASESRKRYTFYRHEKCKCCGNTDKKGVDIVFKDPVENISIFEAECLFAMYCLDEKPFDYAAYHKSPAGKKFIENIDRVVV